MKITLTDNNGTYTIERDCGETLHDYMQELVVPVLLAASFQRQSIEEYLEGAESAEREQELTAERDHWHREYLSASQGINKLVAQIHRGGGEFV